MNEIPLQEKKSHFTATLQGLHSLQTIPIQIDIHSLLPNVQLRDYQVKGIEWISQLYHSEWNGILADDMGLGKTLQSIAFILYLKEIKNRMNGNCRVLVVVPVSILENWKQEFQKFAPSLSKLVFHGDKFKREDIVHEFDQNGNQNGNCDVILTTYEMIHAETLFLKSIVWDYMIVDEGHRLKNRASILYEKLSSLQCTKKIVLTGKLRFIPL